MTKENKTVMVQGVAILGNVTGIIVAVKRKSGFWGGVGWFLLGGLAGAGIGFVMAAAIADKKVDEPKTDVV